MISECTERRRGVFKVAEELLLWGIESLGE